ncbi:MAG: DISARM system SNF2-like helicase DrmD [Planctomycetota bacterium]|nr:DISARM system SNF2-like helicase DrmD [Planctomycetota bacterium]
MSRTAAISPSTPRPGQMVIVRNRPAVVRDVLAKEELPTERQTHLVRVEYIDGWQHPEADEIVWEREVGAQILSSLSLPGVGQASPDGPERLAAFINACRWTALNRLSAGNGTGSQPSPLTSPWHSAVQIEDYQLYPVMKAMLMPRVSLLLADDVGLGKTIEAGLIASELFARRRIRRVLVVCPAALQRQWKDELREKFHLDFNIVDREETFRLQRTLGMDSNPWASFPRVITSMDYLRQSDVFESFRAAAKGITRHNEALLPWQLLIVDEAHNFSPSLFGDDSDRCKMLRQLAGFFEHRLFLTATPHNGYTVSFTGLLELLDPVRFQQTAELNEKDHRQIQVVMVRRLKSELNRLSARPRFASRDVMALSTELTGQEAALFAALRAYREDGLRVVQGLGKREAHLGKFIFTLLTKRLLSSPYAFAHTWWRHVEGLDEGTASTDEAALARDRAEAPVNDDAEKDLREQDAARLGGAWLKQFRGKLRSPMDRVGDALRAIGWTPQSVITPLNGTGSCPADSKWDALAACLAKYVQNGKGFRSDERLIVFTEYKHTLDYILHRFRNLKAGVEEPELQFLFGGADPRHREQIKDQFNDPASPLRILVATDTASEGINLQMSCRYVLHYEIPWNPMRLEQRNGRVDRHGQARDVTCFHFTSNDEADLKFMARVAEKVNQAREDLGSVGQVIDAAIMQHFTSKPVDESLLDSLVAGAQRDEPEHADLAQRDAGDAAEYSKAMQRLRDTELTLGLSQEALAQVLREAMALEGGTLEGPDGEGLYRIVREPPTWKRLVEDTLRISGALPRLVFDPTYFETEVNGRRLYRRKPNTVLLRLGHPLMKRAVGVLKRNMWSVGREQTVSRWTAAGCELPAGLDCILVAHYLLEVTNGLKETAHDEVLTEILHVKGANLVPLEERLRDRVAEAARSALPQAELDSWLKRLRELWLSHQDNLADHLKKLQASQQADFTKKMKAAYQEAERNQKAVFAERLEEIKKRSASKYIQKLLQQQADQEHRLKQGFLFAEIQAAEQRRLDEIREQLAISHFEQMKHLIEQERDRVLKLVLPKRYELASVQVYPLAVEYLVQAKPPAKGGRTR